MIGQTISHYKILEKLGGGGMGVVYKAEDTKLKRTVALKFLPPELTRDEDAKKRFIQEAQAASSLQHNNICTVHDVDETENGQIFISMDFYEGETLKKKIERGQIKKGEAIDIIVQTATGLQKAHEKGIVHRDIKPANIFVTNDGVVKILDFGLAKLSGQTEMTKMGETVGTIAYMSPEQTRGELVDQRTDIWSLGVVLYEMLTGKLPFKGDYEQAMIYSILNEEPKPITNIKNDFPIQIQETIYRCLSKQPANRYQNINEIEAGLNLLKQTKNKVADPFVNKKRLLISRKKMLILGAIITLFVVVGLIWLLKSDNKSGLSYDKSKSIGVLPFVPLNRTQDDSIFAEGIHDDILTQLSKISDLRVIARTSMILYRGTKKRMSEIGDELDVGYLLEGSIRRAGDKLRITAQLLNTETEGYVWADVYDRNETDIFAIQSDIANRIAKELNIRLLPAEKTSIETPMTSNLTAYDYYMKGRYYWANYFDSSGNAKAADMFDSASYYDPNFVEAFALASIVHATMYTPGIKWDHSLERLQKSKTALDKAIALAPDAPEVLEAKGYYYQYVIGDKHKALEEYKVALKDRPGSAGLLIQIGGLYQLLGDLTKAREMLRRARTINPVGMTQVWESLLSAILREWEVARREAEEYLARNPDDPLAYINLADIFIDGFGDIKKARSILEEGKRRPPSIFRGGRQVGPFEFWRIEFYERKFDIALLCLSAQIPSPQSYYVVDKYIQSGYILLAQGDVENSRLTFDSIRVVLEEHIKNEGDYYYDYGRSLAQALAGSGKGEKAILYMKKLLEESSKGPNINLFARKELEEALVKIYVLSGKYKEAIELMENILIKPGTLTVWKLRLDPLYDPLRKDEQFKQLVSGS